MQHFNYMQLSENKFGSLPQHLIQHQHQHQIQQHQIQQHQIQQHQIQQNQIQQNQIQHYPNHQFQMQVPSQNLVLPQYYQDNTQQYCQPIFFEPLPPVYVKNQLLPSPIMMQMPTTVVVQNESQPAMVLNQPPSNIVVKNNPPTPVYVKQSNPNVVVKNETSPNFVPGIEACQDTITPDNMNHQMMTSTNRSIM